MAQAARAAASTAPELSAPLVEPERTSLAARNNDPDNVTVRFIKWHAFGLTAYQRSQCAGFKQHEAMRLVAAGVAVVADPAAVTRTASDRFMMTK